MALAQHHPILPAEDRVRQASYQQLPYEHAYWLHPGCLLIALGSRAELSSQMVASVMAAGQSIRPAQVTVCQAETELAAPLRWLVVALDQPRPNETLLLEDVASGQTWRLPLDREAADQHAMQLFRPLSSIASAKSFGFITELLRAIPAPADSNFDQQCQSFMAMLSRHVSKPAKTEHFTRSDYPFQISLLNCLAAGESGLWITAQIVDEQGLLKAVEVMNPVITKRIPSLKRYQFFEAGKNEQGQPVQQFCQFFAFDELAEADWRLADWRELPLQLRFHLTGGGRITLTPELKQFSPEKLRVHILRSLIPASISLPLVRDVLRPAMLSITHSLDKMNRLKESHVYGPPISREDRGIIIPLYRNYDFIPVQCAKFALEPELKGRAITYVLDCPEDAEEVKARLKPLAMLYQLSIKLVILKRNYGYAYACNTGAEVTAASTLIFLNSDAFPKAPGWLDALCDPLDAPQEAGIVGAKLLYEDETIQHAGIYFVQNQERLLLGGHQREGQPNSDAAANESGEKLAVTGACFAMRRELFRQLGGFTTDFVIGDFEDIDLCLKCRDNGNMVYYAADAELYHFQRQSLPSHSDYGNQIWEYNARIHELKWGKELRGQLQKAGEKNVS